MTGTLYDRHRGDNRGGAGRAHTHISRLPRPTTRSHGTPIRHSCRIPAAATAASVAAPTSRRQVPTKKRGSSIGTLEEASTKPTDLFLILGCTSGCAKNRSGRVDIQSSRDLNFLRKRSPGPPLPSGLPTDGVAGGYYTG